MFSLKAIRLKALFLLVFLLITTPLLCSAAGLSDLLGNKKLAEEERKETIERIESIQEKLKLLQDKLRVLERRKAAKQATQRAGAASGVIAGSPVQINWLPIDETTTDPGEFGLYTYLLFKGDLADVAAIGILEDFILSIETLPEQEIPASFANRFLIPVEKPQSLVSLGRQPYDFKLNEVLLRRFALPSELPSGPVLVSSRVAVDPYAEDGLPAYLAVGLGRQTPQRAVELAGIWHQQEIDPVTKANQPITKLFWQLIKDGGPALVTHNGQQTMVVLPQQ